jgi:Transposase IS200 like
VLRPGGVLVAAAISRFASTYDGLLRVHLDEPAFQTIVERDLLEGQHRNPTRRPEWFTTAYFHLPDELGQEVAEAGLRLDAVLAVEGPGGMLPDVGTPCRSGPARAGIDRDPACRGRAEPARRKLPSFPPGGTAGFIQQGNRVQRCTWLDTRSAHTACMGSLSEYGRRVRAYCRGRTQPRVPPGLVPEVPPPRPGWPGRRPAPGADHRQVRRAGLECPGAGGHARPGAPGRPLRSRRLPARLAHQLKGATSRALRQEFPQLRSRLPTLWSKSYFVASVGRVSEATIGRYIAEQTTRPTKGVP